MEKEKEKKHKKTTAAGDGGGKKEHKPNWREVHATPEDIQQFLSDNIFLRHNMITGEQEFRVPEKDEFETFGMTYPSGATPLDEWCSATEWYTVNDRLVNSLCNMLSTRKEVSVKNIWQVIGSDFVPLYHPFLSYLTRLPPWDEATNPILELAMSVHAITGPGHIDM